MKLAVGYRSDVGRKRARNEDAVLIQQLDNGALLVAVADGMGGLPAGEVASRTAIGVLREELAGSDGSFADASKILTNAFKTAHTAIRHTSKTWGRMGTTLVAAMVRDATVYIANVGDSRAYLVGRASVSRVTDDHTIAAEGVRAGLMSEVEANESRLHNLLTRAVGLGSEPPQVDVFGPLALQEDQLLVLCSDGLYAPVADEEIAMSVRCCPLQVAADHLVNLANERGGPDNISVVVVGLR